MTSMVSIDLPFPPSGHHLYRKHKGAHLSKAYREWRDCAGWTLKEQQPASVSGQVGIVIDIVPPDGRRRDLDNLIKPIVDLLVTHQVIDGDGIDTVPSILITAGGTGEPGKCQVRIFPILEATAA